MSSSHGPQQRSSMRRDSSESHDGSHREEDPNREPSDSHASRRQRRGAADASATPGAHWAQLSTRQLAEDGYELLSRTALRRSRHAVPGAPPAPPEARAPGGLFGNFSFANHDKAHFRTDDLFAALDDADPHIDPSARRQRDERSRSPGHGELKMFSTSRSRA
ncbi:hypothetical protein JCM8208_007059 [Rhodotorula glutinis]